MNSEQDTLVDIYDLFLDYARGHPVDSDIKQRVDLKALKIEDIDLTNFKVSNQETVYTGSTDAIVMSPSCKQKSKVAGLKSYVVFSSNFTNNSGENQSNHLRTERYTRATCRLRLSKSVTFGGNLNLQIGPPNAWIQASGGSRRDVTMQKREKFICEDLTWSFDANINIPSGYRNRADLVMTEEEFEARFRIKTIFEGRIIIPLCHKKTSKPLSYICLNDLTSVLTPVKGFHPVADRPGAVYFISEGNCTCSCGIKQHVELHQQSIEGEEDESRKK